MGDDSKHLEFERLTDLALSEIAEAEQSAIAQHLGSCALCATRYARVEKTVGVMRTDRLEEVPSHILERTYSLLADRTIAPVRPTFTERLTAILRIEIASQVPAFGIRSGHNQTARRLWFTAGDIEIDLRVRKNQDLWEVDGQVFSSFVGGRATLQKSSLSDVSSELSDVGEFSFGAVTGGDYTLVLNFADFEIDFPAIRISD